MGSINGHKFTHFAMKDPKLQALPDSVEDEDNFKYFIDVYVDDFISMVIACSRKQVEHVAEAVLQGLHNVFDNDPASFKKLTKGDGTFSTEKDCLGFDFDGDIGKRQCSWRQSRGTPYSQHFTSGYGVQNVATLQSPLMISDPPFRR